MSDTVTSFRAQVLQRRVLLGTIGALALCAALFVWTEIGRESIARWAEEDGVLENLSALFFFLAGVGLAAVCFRSTLLSARQNYWVYFFTFGLALLMIVFAGEEISWGQRVFGIETPGYLSDANYQGEINIHNLNALRPLTHRILTLFAFVVGVALPVAALFAPVQRLIQRLGVPVLPIMYSGIFVGSLIYGTYYARTLPDAYYFEGEVREFIMACGMLCFGIHGVLRPDDLFRYARVE